MLGVPRLTYNIKGDMTTNNYLVRDDEELMLAAVDAYARRTGWREVPDHYTHVRTVNRRRYVEVEGRGDKPSSWYSIRRDGRLRHRPIRYREGNHYSYCGTYDRYPCAPAWGNDLTEEHQQCEQWRVWRIGHGYLEGEWGDGCATYDDFARVAARELWWDTRPASASLTLEYWRCPVPTKHILYRRFIERVEWYKAIPPTQG